MLSTYAKSEWLTIAAAGALLTITLLIVGWWWLAIPTIILTFALISFFRDPDRRIPSQRGIVVSPADGRVSSIHEIEHFEPLNGPAVCVRIFLSVANVHVNRSPCHCIVQTITHKPGLHRNALNPESAEDNESNFLALYHPTRQYPIAAVRQVAGLLARTIYCGVREGQILQRGERLGIIKLGSTTELYLPHTLKPEVQIQQGQKVQGGTTVIANIRTPNEPQGPPGRHDHPQSDLYAEEPSDAQPDAETAEPIGSAKTPEPNKAPDTTATSATSSTTVSTDTSEQPTATATTSPVTIGSADDATPLANESDNASDNASDDASDDDTTDDDKPVENVNGNTEENADKKSALNAETSVAKKAEDKAGDEDDGGERGQVGRQMEIGELFYSPDNNRNA